MPAAHVFLSGRAAAPTPLERYLPPLPVGVASAWLAANLQPGDWLLDPFGSAPLAALEAARAGNRVAVAAGNPVAQFLLELRARAPGTEALRAALAELAAARRGDERLESALLELYKTTCPACGAQIPAEAFIWAREADAPHAKLLDCKACGQAGEYDTDDADKERARGYQRQGPHLARALQRIAPQGDPDRGHAEEALEAYLPRAVYALVTLFNRVEGMQLPPEEHDLVSALLLSACDRATSLWAHPTGRLRPRQLSAPAQFREYNLWYEMERSIALWAEDGPQVPLVRWPEPPPEGGISLFEGPLRDMPGLDKAPIKAVLGVFPRPNQAFWTLCALWAGWLWGREAIGPFAAVLRRKRYDWAWHAEALHAALAALEGALPADTPLFGVVCEAEAGFNAAALTAANLAGFRLEGMAMRRDQGQLQLDWRKGMAPAKVTDTAPQAVERAAGALLKARGEPSHFLHLQTAGLAELSRRALLGGVARGPGELFTETRETIEAGLGKPSFQRFGGSQQSLETGSWWLADPAGSRSPLADRIEIATVRYLLRRPGGSLEQIDRMLCEIFPGLLTPAVALVEAALKSYGEEGDGLWRISEADQPRARRGDLQEVRGLLSELGGRLGYVAGGELPVEWRDASGKLVLAFYPIASAVLGELLLAPATPPAHSLVVLPGRRSRLALEKLGRDPRLAAARDAGWRFLKFRHVRRLAGTPRLDAQSFAELLELDPLTLEEAQTPLL
ncbi:MAG: hypothetical protein KIS85_06540 [Anaerolineales bacterium]|nr:hypothetical protein [Anaerolineales bacterium]